MNRQRSPWRRWLFGIAATTGLVAYALGAALMAQSAPEPPPQQDFYQITLTFLHKDGNLTDDHREKLDVLAEIMKKTTNRMPLKAMIVGYAAPDEILHGGNALSLARVRARQAWEYLVEHHHIDPSRVQNRGEVCSPENDEVYKCQKAVITLNPL